MNLYEIFSENVGLIKILWTLPMTTVETERRHNRINRFLPDLWVIGIFVLKSTIRDRSSFTRSHKTLT